MSQLSMQTLDFALFQGELAEFLRQSIGVVDGLVPLKMLGLGSHNIERFILTLSEKLDVTIDVPELTNIKTVDDLFGYVESEKRKTVTVGV